MSTYSGASLSLVDQDFICFSGEVPRWMLRQVPQGGMFRGISRISTTSMPPPPPTPPRPQAHGDHDCYQPQVRFIVLANLPYGSKYPIVQHLLLSWVILSAVQVMGKYIFE